MSLRNIRHAAAVVAVGIIATQTCLAQFETIDKSRIGIGISLLRPTSSKLRNVNDVWFGPMVDVHILNDSYGRPTAIASIGWFGEEDGSSRASLVPLKFTYIKRYNKEGGGGWYAGGGLDIFLAKYQGYEYDPFTRSPRWVDESGTPLGVNLLAGVEFGGAWYGELRYDAVTSLDLPVGGSVDFSCLSINVGSRLAF